MTTPGDADSAESPTPSPASPEPASSDTSMTVQFHFHRNEENYVEVATHELGMDPYIVLALKPGVGIGVQGGGFRHSVENEDIAQFLEAAADTLQAIAKDVREA
jgi:hypothetical protein